MNKKIIPDQEQREEKIRGNYKEFKREKEKEIRKIKGREEFKRKSIIT